MKIAPRSGEKDDFFIPDVFDSTARPTVGTSGYYPLKKMIHFGLKPVTSGKKNNALLTVWQDKINQWS